MGKVAVTLNIMPESPETDMTEIKEALKRLGVEVKSTTEKPVAFGLKMLEVLLVMEDREGGLDALQEKIEKIKGVESVEAGDVSLI